MKEFAKLMVVGIAYGIGVSIPIIATFAIKTAIDQKDYQRRHKEEK